MNGLINFFILWGPTLLFILILAVAITLGILRGLRKSIILLIQSLGAFVICFIFYLIVVNTPSTDSGFVSFLNMFLGSNGLQEMMGVSENCKGLKEILIEYIPKQLDFGDGLMLIIQDNGAYLGSLVSFTYHILFAVIFGLLYLLLIFVLYIIYQIFYPERRHIKKLEKKNALLETEKTYKKRRMFGGLVGLGRGLVGGLVCMSFLGSLLYIFAGGIGEKKYDDYSFGDENTDTIYSIYQSVGEYGTTGIFKILNSVKNSDNVPYYLFAADIVFSGGLNDDNRDIHTNIAFTEEFGAYTGFARNTFDLVMKYGADDVKPIILGEYEGDVMEVLIKVFSTEGFQDEFNKLIDDFDAKTYFVNFSLSLIDSIVKHFDELSIEGLSNDAKEIVNILFKDGYLSDYIPEERQIKDNLAINPNFTYNSPAHLTASKLLTEDDVKSLLKGVLGLLSLENTDEYGEKLDDTAQILLYSKNVIPHIKNLSILGSDRKSEINPVLVRLYSYLENRYLSSLGEESEPQLMSYYLSNTTVDSFDWISEIQFLLDVAIEAIPLYERVYDPNIEAIEMVFNIFDKNNEHYSKNVESYANIKNALSDSKLLGRVLATKSIYQIVEDSLVGVLKDIYIPTDIEYGNVYDENGNLVKNGELYQVLSALEILLKNENLKPLVMKVYNEEVDFNDQNQLLEFADEAISLLTDKDASGHDMVDYLLDSRVFEAILSGFIISNKEIDPNTGISLYIPNDVLQTVDGEYVNIIDKSIIKDVVHQLPGVLDIADGFLNMDNPNYNSIDAALKNPVIDELLDNIVIEGTLVNIIGNTLSADDVKEFITMPEDYVNLDGTLNVSKWLESNELTNLINGVRRSGLVLDELVFMGELSEAQQQTVIMAQLKDNLNTEAFDDLLSSNVLHSVISGFLIDKEYSGIAIIVPNSSLYANNKLINKDEIKDILSQIPKLIPDDMEDTNGMIKQIVANKDELLKTPTLLATIVNYININLIPTLPRDLFIVPKSLEDSADTLSRDTIYGDYSGLYFINFNENNNLWINEAPALVDALDVLLGLTGDNPLDFNSSTLEDDINNKLTENISKLNDKYDDNFKNIDVVYESLIIQATLANTLDNAFTDDTIIDRGALLSLKVNDIYPKSEVSALVDAINELDLDLLGEINIASIDLFALNDASAVIQGKTKLDVVYESKIIDYIIYKQLGSNLENIMKDKDGNIRKLSDNAYEGLEYKYYAKNEIEYSIKSLNLFDISMSDIDNANSSDLLMNKIKSNIKSFGSDEVDIIYSSEIIRNALSVQIGVIDGIVVPNEAYVLDNTYSGSIDNKVIDDVEVLNIISAINDLGISLDSPEFDYIVLNDTTAQSLSKSCIIRATVYETLSNNAEIVIPNTAVENDNISDTELESLLGILNNNKSTLYKSEDISADGKVRIANIDVNNATVGILDDMLGSEILFATISYKLPTLGIDNIVISDDLKASAAKNVLENSFDVSPWRVELPNMIDGLALITGTDKKFSDSDFADSISSNVTNLDDAKIDTVCASNIILASISDIINNTDGLKKPDNAYDSDSYLVDGIEVYNILKDEIKALILAAKAIDIKLTLGTDLNTIVLNNDTADKMSSSKIIRNTLHDNISSNVVMPTMSLDFGYISESECNKLLNILANNKSSFFTDITGDKVNINSINVDANALTLSQVLGMTESLVLHATIINTLKDNTDLVVPDRLKNVDPKELGNTDFSWGYNNDNYEVVMLLSGFGVLGIDENQAINTINEDLIIDGITNLNSLNINTFYKSEIMKATISNNITSNSYIQKPNQAYDATLEYVKDNVSYKIISQQEVLALSKAIKELDINLNSLSFTSIKLKSDNSVISSSHIIRGTISEELKNAEAITVPYDVLDNEGYLEYSELTKVLDLLYASFADSEGLITLSSIDVNSLTITNIKALTESDVLNATIIDNILGISPQPLSIPSAYNLVNFDVENGYNNSKWIINDEVDKLLSSIEILAGSSTTIEGISLMSFDSINIGLKPNTNSNSLAESDIMRATISTSIEGSLVVPSDSKDSEGYITKLELVDLLDLLSDSFADGSGYIELNSIDVGTLTISDVKKLQNSNILAATIVDNIVNTDGLKMPYEYKEIDFENSGYSNTLWSNGELSSLLQALEALALSQQIVNININIDEIEEEDMDLVTQSVVMKTTFNEEILGLSLQIPSGAYDSISYKLTSTAEEKYYITNTEMKNLVKSVKAMGLDLTNADFETIDLVSKSVDDICASLIVSKAISDNLTSNNQIVIPISCMDTENDMISNQELKLLLIALQDNNLGTDVSFDDFTLGQITSVESIANSTIMRATITKNITVDENPAYASEGDVDIIDGHAVLTSEELTDFVNAAMSICGDDSGLSIVIDDALLNSVMTTDDLKAKVLLSSVMTNIIGSLLYNQTGYGKTISAINLATALEESIKVIEFE